jgi:hypothetical protein
MTQTSAPTFKNVSSRIARPGWSVPARTRDPRLCLSSPGRSGSPPAPPPPNVTILSHGFSMPGRLAVWFRRSQPMRWSIARKFRRVCPRADPRLCRHRRGAGCQRTIRRARNGRPATASRNRRPHRARYRTLEDLHVVGLKLGGAGIMIGPSRRSRWRSSRWRRVMRVVGLARFAPRSEPRAALRTE